MRPNGSILLNKIDCLCIQGLYWGSLKNLGCKVIYRRVATKGELQYYLRRFATSEYNDYSIFYLSFHGDTHSIFLEGEKKTEKKLTLKELSAMAKEVFTDRFVHFSSCRTLLESDKELEEFKNDEFCVNGKYWIQV